MKSQLTSSRLHPFCSMFIKKDSYSSCPTVWSQRFLKASTSCGSRGHSALLSFPSFSAWNDSQREVWIQQVRAASSTLSAGVLAIIIMLVVVGFFICVGGVGVGGIF